MLANLFERDDDLSHGAPNEGSLYKKVTTFGKTFELRYGYYEERDRINPLCNPVVIYPDFLSSPLYTDSGEPFVTAMQDACGRYDGEEKRTPDTTCAECKYYSSGEEWFGLCTCADNKKNSNANSIDFEEE